MPRGTSYWRTKDENSKTDLSPGIPPDFVIRRGQCITRYTYYRGAPKEQCQQR